MGVLTGTGRHTLERPDVTNAQTTDSQTWPQGALEKLCFCQLSPCRGDGCEGKAGDLPKAAS